MEKQRLRSAQNSTLPLTSEIPDPEIFKQATHLLKEGIKLRAKISELEESASDLREQLAVICAAYDLKGLRHGLAGFEYHGYKTRQTLSKEKLLANGVSADIIAKSFSEGEPYLMTKFVAFDIE